MEAATTDEMSDLDMMNDPDTRSNWRVLTCREKGVSVWELRANNMVHNTYIAFPFGRDAIVTCLQQIRLLLILASHMI